MTQVSQNQSTKILTEKIITGQGTFDNGQFADKFNKTSQFEVSLMFFYGKIFVNATEILNNGVRGSHLNCSIDKVTNPIVLKAANKLIFNL